MGKCTTPYHSIPLRTISYLSVPLHSMPYMHSPPQVDYEATMATKARIARMVYDRFGYETIESLPFKVDIWVVCTAFIWHDLFCFLSLASFASPSPSSRPAPLP